MPYTKKIWCPHPIHSSLTRSGSKPTHPIGVRLIKEIEAQVFNKQIMVKPEWTPVTMKGGDKVCQTCFNSLGDLMDKYLYEEPVLIETPESEKHQPPFSQLSYIRIFNKIENNMTIQWNQIVARVDFQPTVGRRNQLLLSKEQFNMIRTQCSQK